MLFRSKTVPPDLREPSFDCNRRDSGLEKLSRPVDCQHHEGSPVSHLVHHRWPDGQFAEAAAAGAGRRGSHRCRVSGGDRRIRGHGIIGLFVGAIVLSVGYKLFVAWIEPDTVEEQSA